jgi:hypothetical protein
MTSLSCLKLQQLQPQFHLVQLVDRKLNLKLATLIKLLQRDPQVLLLRSGNTEIATAPITALCVGYTIQEKSFLGAMKTNILSAQVSSIFGTVRSSLTP